MSHVPGRDTSVAMLTICPLFQMRPRAIVVSASLDAAACCSASRAAPTDIPASARWSEVRVRYVQFEYSRLNAVSAASGVGCTSAGSCAVGDAGGGAGWRPAFGGGGAAARGG